MITKIVIEVVLVIITFFAGGLFWHLQRRGKYLAQIICNEPFLSQFVSRDALESASPMITPFAEKNQVGYFLNIKLVIDADRISQRRTKLIFLAILAAAFTGSYFLGVPYLAVSIVIFFLSGLGPLSPSVQSSALQHVLAIALILDRWRTENTAECEQWIEQARSLRPLYNAVKAAQ